MEKKQTPQKKLPKALLEKYAVSVSGDSGFQGRLRLLQSLWREEQGLPKEEDDFGNYLPEKMAKEDLAGYLDETIRNVVRTEVQGPKSEGKLFTEPRIFNNLLSSQPLCFNLFAHLQQNLDLATDVFSQRCLQKVKKVIGIEFEWSPGRGNVNYTGDRSAFDVFVIVETPSGEKGFMGIEVKYHENLSAVAAEPRDRYEEVTRKSGMFDLKHLPRLKMKPLEQIWRDHLLALSMLQADDGWAEGTFVYLAPEDNIPCANGAKEYATCLTDKRTFESWTLESLVADIEENTDADWIRLFSDRYLGFDKIDRILENFNR